jgi:hypothetical protein
VLTAIIRIVGRVACSHFGSKRGLLQSARCEIEPDRLLLYVAPIGRAGRRVNDIHFHPVEPLSFRAALTTSF